MNLFVLQDNIAKPNIEILLISPFKDIWERDTDPKKALALKEFTYVEFMASPRKTNPFNGYADYQKPAKVKEAIFKDNTEWVPDALVTEAIKFYSDLFEAASPNLSLLKSARSAAMKLEVFLNGIDYTERTKSGMPVYKPKEITSAIGELKDVFRNLEALDKMVQQDIYDTVKTKSNRDINYFEEVH